nr:hypothetical protein [Pseudonocardia sp. H11422]
MRPAESADDVLHVVEDLPDGAQHGGGPGTWDALDVDHQRDAGQAQVMAEIVGRGLDLLWRHDRRVVVGDVLQQVGHGLLADESGGEQ